MVKKKVLIIDDEGDFALLVKKNLELIGDFEVDMAINGKEGIEKARNKNPDVILLDILMPGLDGFEVLKKLKEDKKTMTIPVLMLTAKGDEESKIKAAQLYDEAYITKPIEASDLKAKIEEVLKREGFPS